MQAYKSFLLFLIIGSFGLSSQAQLLFNNQYRVMDYISGNGFLLVDGDSLISISDGTDINPYNYLGLGFAKYDLQGNMIRTQFSRGEDFEFWQIWPNNNGFVKNNKIITTLLGPPWRGLYVEIDKFSGIMLKKRIIEFRRQGELQWYYGGENIKPISDTKYAVLGTIKEKDKKETDALISIVDLVRDTIKHIEAGVKNYFDYYNAMIPVEDGFILGGRLTDRYYKEIDFTLQETIVKIDTLGNELWRYISADSISRGYIHDMLLESDGSIVYTAVESIQIYEEWLGQNEVYDRPMISKIDANHEPVWQRPLWQKSYFWTNYFKRILRSIDGDGYVAAGQVYSGNYDEPTDQDGYMLKNGEPLQMLGLMAKVSNEGDSLWSRTYKYVSMPDAHNEIDDMDYAPDGGYILFGSCSRDTGDTLDVLIYAWMLKVDQHGCLIPGCQDTTSTSDYTIPELPVKVYPNPAGDELYIYQSEGKKTHYTIFDMQGDKMDNFTGNYEGETLILRIAAYPAGTYILRVETEDGKSGVKRFVKVK